MLSPSAATRSATEPPTATEHKPGDELFYYMIFNDKDLGVLAAVARIQLDRAEGKEWRATVTAWRFFNAEGRSSSSPSRSSGRTSC